MAGSVCEETLVSYTRTWRVAHAGFAASSTAAAMKLTMAGTHLATISHVFSPRIRQESDERLMAESGLTYRDAGVDIDAGDELVERIKPLVRKTMRKEVLAGIGGFGALVEVPLDRYKKPVLVSGTDGVGTKLRPGHRYRSPRQDRHRSRGHVRQRRRGNEAPSPCSSWIITPPASCASMWPKPWCAASPKAATRWRRAGRWRDRRDARHVSRRRL